MAGNHMCWAGRDKLDLTYIKSGKRNWLDIKEKVFHGWGNRPINKVLALQI